jgi:inner membrane transporter RhtA
MDVMDDSGSRGRAAGAVVVGSGFHYLGPAFAVLLFAHVDALGVAWLRLATAAGVLAVWRRPWKVLRRLSAHERRTLVAWGAVLAGMNTAFYLALDRAPLATVASIEFLGVIGLAAWGVRSRRNLTALAVAVVGVALLTQVTLAGSPAGLAWAVANAVGFVLYVVLGHRVATTSGTGTGPDGVDRLAVAVGVAACVAVPVGVDQALPALGNPVWLAWGAAIGICSTVIPYVADQVAMARLPRATYALMLSLLPVTATVCGVLVLGQVPGTQELGGIVLVCVGVAVHRPAEVDEPGPGTSTRHRLSEGASR